VSSDWLEALGRTALSEGDIDRLITEGSGEQRQALVENPSVSEHHLRRLACDEEEAVRRAAYGELGIRGTISVGDAGKELVDQGAFGDVYRVRMPDGSFIARKEFNYRGALRHLEVARARFLRGANVMKDTLGGHPRIVTVFDIDDSDPAKPAYTMEYVPGGDLTALINEPEVAARLLDFQLEEDGTVPLAIRLRILIDLCDAVNAAHARDVVHRDIKPRNVLLLREDDLIRAKITDFDVSFGPGLSEITASADIFATQFSPPWLQINYEGGKLATSSPTQDKRTLHTDHFGVAATTFFCLTGAHPHPGKFCNDKLDEELTRAAGTLVERPLRELIGVIREALAVSEPEDLKVLTGNIRHHLAAFERESAVDERIGGIFIYATPDDQDRIRVDQELKGVVKHALERNDEASLQELAIVPAASLNEFGATLRQHPDVRMIWLGGHGNKSFAFEENGKTVEADLARLEVVLKPHLPPRGQLQCIVFNCCKSDELAEQLSDRLRISFVIGAHGPLDDRAAVAFSKGMMDGLVAGRGYAAAFDLGVAAVGAAIGPEAANRYVRHERNYPALGWGDMKTHLNVVQGDSATPRQKREALVALAKLQVGVIENAKLNECDVSDIDLTGIEMPELQLAHGTAVNTGLSSAVLITANLEGVTFTRANLNSAIAEHSNFNGARLTDANANQFFAPNSSFVNSNWFQVTATACQCEGGDFAGANLASANLSRGSFVGCRFDGASLVHAILSRAIFRDAHFGDADVRFADFSRTHLGGADLSRVRNIDEASFFKVYHDEATRWPEGFEPPESAAETWTAF
jgi:uncharacterized protein YjbI with pentapeptide repeats/serine/threonine protein kinase